MDRGLASDLAEPRRRATAPPRRAARHGARSLDLIEAVAQGLEGVAQVLTQVLAQVLAPWFPKDAAHLVVQAHGLVAGQSLAWCLAPQARAALAHRPPGHGRRSRAASRVAFCVEYLDRSRRVASCDDYSCSLVDFYVGYQTDARAHVAARCLVPFVRTR